MSIHNIINSQRNILLLSIISTFVILSCNNQPENKTSKTDFDQIDSLRATFLTIEDSLLHTWNVMINDDNNKIKSLKRLVLEVIYAGGVDSTITQDLLTQVKLLKSKRYTQETMIDSDLIDYYDSCSNALINSVITLASTHQEFERNIVMNEMIDEINQSEGQILYYRIDYDDVAKLHNKFISQNEALMKEIDSKEDRHQLPIFELPLDQ